MPIEQIISMFEQKFAKNFEEIVLLNCNLPIFSLLNMHRGYVYMFEDMIV